MNKTVEVEKKWWINRLKYLCLAFKRCRVDPDFESCIFEAIDESAAVLKDGEFDERAKS